MKKESGVINASPWIALSVCGQVSLLEKLYGNILMPMAVKQEIMAGGRNRIGTRELGESAWCWILSINKMERIFGILFSLGIPRKCADTISDLPKNIE